jgi:predicted nucleotidyltransferase
MKELDEIRKTVIKHRDVLAQQYGVAVVGVFGSYVRGEERAGSDLDLLVEILRPIDLLELVGAEIYLTEVYSLKHPRTA